MRDWRRRNKSLLIKMIHIIKCRCSNFPLSLILLGIFSIWNGLFAPLFSFISYVLMLSHHNHHLYMIITIIICKPPLGPHYSQGLFLHLLRPCCVTLLLMLPGRTTKFFSWGWSLEKERRLRSLIWLATVEGDSKDECVASSSASPFWGHSELWAVALRTTHTEWSTK